MPLKNIETEISKLNFHDSGSTALIDDYHKTLLDIINCQKTASLG